jgi:hypothetical protein
LQGLRARRGLGFYLLTATGLGIRLILDEGSGISFRSALIVRTGVPALEP